MNKRDKKVQELNSLLKILKHLQPDLEYVKVLDEISQQLGYRVPTVAAQILQSKKIIDAKFSDIFLGFEVLSLAELKATYSSNRKSKDLFLGAFQIQDDYATSPDYEFRLYGDPEDHYAEEVSIDNVKHLLPLFSVHGDYIAINLKPESYGELVLLGADYSATLLAPDLIELIKDVIKGLEQNVYLINEDTDIVTPHNWYLKKKVRDGLLEMDEYGEIVYEDASEPYTNNELGIRRVFKTPIIVPMTVVIVICIYLGYALLHFSGAGLGVLEDFKGVAFEIFILSQVGILATSRYNAKLLQDYFVRNPVISDPSQIEDLKPIVRSNMYSALLVICLLIISALSAVMALIYEAWIYKVAVSILCTITAIVFNRFNVIEERVKNIPVKSLELEPELNRILQCWMHKPFPNF